MREKAGLPRRQGIEEGIKYEVRRRVLSKRVHREGMEWNVRMKDRYMNPNPDDSKNKHLERISKNQKEKKGNRGERDV